jgi:hypothetical protein
MLLSCCLQFSLLHLCALKAVINVCAATICTYHLHLSLSCMLVTCKPFCHTAFSVDRH